MKNKKNCMLVSACLLGHKVRYDGQDNLQTHDRLQALIKEGRVVSICPEVSGGLSTPRLPAEIEPGFTAEDVLNGNAKVLTVNGDDVSAEYIAGATKALKLALENNIKIAILKARSPSCGSSQIYDGYFEKNLKLGRGVTAALLVQNGINVFNEGQIDDALDLIA